MQYSSDFFNDNDLDKHFIEKHPLVLKTKEKKDDVDDFLLA